MTDDEVYETIETALNLDADTLYDTEYLEKQVEVETHYNRAAELYFHHENHEAKEHMQRAYGAADELEQMVSGYEWRRARKELEE